MRNGIFLAAAAGTLLIHLPSCLPAQAEWDSLDQPRELGAVAWQRDYEAAQDEAREQGRPMLVLFQEVPGCATCVHFGRDVLSHPVLVGVAQSHFVPVCIHNNTRGDADARVREAFGEPAWNNPVVRVLDGEGEALAPRLSGDWSLRAMAETMARGLEQAEQSVPEALQLLLAEERAKTRAQQATFEMACFWSGEAGLGRLDGVLSTRPGWLGGREVVEVTYDPKATDFAQLAHGARESGAARGVFPTAAQRASAGEVFGSRVYDREDAGSFRVDRDLKYYLGRTSLRLVPMTGLQAARVNAHLRTGDWRRFLSQAQLDLLETIAAHPGAGWPEALGQDPATGWRAVAAILEGLASGDAPSKR